MSKLGEEKLGSVQFATPGPFEIETDDVRERAEEHMKSPFPTDEGTTWDKFLAVVLEDAKIHNEIAGDIIDDRFVETASQKQLGMLGEYFGLERRADEGDDHFRARIKSQLPRNTAKATANDVIRIAARLINSTPQRITLEEPHAIEPARFDIQVEEIAFDDTEITEDEFETLLDNVRGAGIKVHATVGKQFTHRSEEDYLDDVNDPQRGHGGINQDYIDYITDEPNQITLDAQGNYETADTGGVYADEVTAAIFN